MRFNWYIGDISRKESSHIIFLAKDDMVKTDSPRIFLNHHWRIGTYVSLVPSTYYFHLFLCHYTTTSSSLSATKPEGDNDGDISVRGSGRSGGGRGGGTCGGYGSGSGGCSGGFTSIFDGNGATVVGFLTGETITGSATTVISMVGVWLSKTAVKIVKAPLTSCAVLFWDWGSVFGGGVGGFFMFLWILWTLFVELQSPRM